VQQKPDLLEQAHTEVRGLPCRVGRRLTQNVLRKGNQGGRVSFAVSQEPEDSPHVNASLIRIDGKGKIRITMKKSQKHKRELVTAFLGDLRFSQAQKAKKSFPKEVNFSVQPEKLDTAVGARAPSEPNLAFIKWG